MGDVEIDDAHDGGDVAGKRKDPVGGSNDRPCICNARRIRCGKGKR